MNKYEWKQQKVHVNRVATECSELDKMGWEIFQIIGKNDAILRIEEHVTIVARRPITITHVNLPGSD